MKIRLTKWGNSIGIRLPKPFVVQMGMQVGKEVEVSMHHDALIISKAETLDDLLDRMTPDVLHGEMDWGLPVGKEIW